MEIFGSMIGPVILAGLSYVLTVYQKCKVLDVIVVFLAESDCARAEWFGILWKD